MIRRIPVFLIVIIMIMVQTAVFTSYGEEEEGKKEDFNLYSQSAVLIDGDSGRILYGKNEEQQRPMASTTKIMTCILALEHGSLDDVVTASSNAAAQPKVHLSVRNGEEFYLKDLLYSLMLESHNDSAVMIAEHIGGSVEGFAAMMNQKARDLGCNDSFFITPNGLDAKVSLEGQEKMHSTSAADLSRIMKYSYVGAVRKDDRTFIIALLGCGWPPHKTYKWSDARTLFQYGLDNYQYKDVFKEVDLKPVTVSMGISDNGDISQDPACKLSLLLKPDEKELRVLMNDQEHVEVSCRIPKNLKAPVYANTPVGSVTYSLNGENIKVYPVYACSTIEKINFKWCLKKITNSLLSGITCPQF